jgi:2-keto-3-deoxy-6-phosphogluconate aldolase
MPIGGVSGNKCWKLVKQACAVGIGSALLDKEAIKSEDY